MKYLLITHMEPGARDGLAEHERDEISRGHRALQERVREAGEMIATNFLADASQGSVVRVKDGRATAAPGPLPDVAVHAAGYYLVDCESRERAEEWAAMIPDARFDGFAVEVRPVMVSAGTEM
ncbi:hypothetical protein A6A06_20895 [Streptomyces sp. CB02923]|uniref:YciI family protein n=1 Tax=Streptomyces sp. CB02923 TaxID=1718985 RepID=UPI00093CCA9C|nr:YciI family protein [Streptomyces sp. CB02923]OKI01261.1 hypothetical protein A6A06_20895 [Streptomyces sp. CB02923]